MQARSKATKLVMLHSIVPWKVDIDNGELRFEIVLRYAERLVAKKLALETAAKLKEARRQNMAPLSSAEGYGGAHFEAYAI